MPNSGGDGANGAGAVVEFYDPHARKIAGHGLPAQCLRDTAQAAVTALVGLADDLVGRGATNSGQPLRYGMGAIADLCCPAPDSPVIH
jgi:hypothetical protein